jgi:hypothetical protein
VATKGFVFDWKNHNTEELSFSKVIYQCGVLDIPENYVELLDEIAYNFVWDNKPNKIKRKTLIADYEYGGLKMLDIGSFIKAQKAMWVKRLATNDQASWKALPNFFLQGLLAENTFKCNMECKTKPKNFPEFYWQILKYWFEVKSLATKQDNVFDIRREVLWLNKNIRLNGKEVRWNTWQENGINIIHDIVNEKGVFLTPTQLEIKYHIKCDTLKYNALKSVIPFAWRKKLKTMNVPDEAISFEEEIYLNIKKTAKRIKDITNRDLYWLLVQNIQQKPIVIDSTGKIFDIDEDEWKIIFKTPLIIKRTKLRTFQYKILYNLIPCNLYLNRIRRSDSNKCDLCKKLDDLGHYFYECQPVHTFWNRFGQWWHGMTGENIVIDKKMCIFGTVDNSIKNKLLNACIIIAKWYIFKMKLDQAEIFFYKFLCDLKYYIITEKTIALRNNKLLMYQKTWKLLEEHLT